jgi:hypothetical protein
MKYIQRFFGSKLLPPSASLPMLRTTAGRGRNNSRSAASQNIKLAQDFGRPVEH